METHEQKRLVNAYIKRYSRYDPAIGRQEVRSFWVWQACDWLCVNDPERLWRLVIEILDRTESPRVLDALAAGELEDLIEYHGPAFIERIERETARDPRFRRLLCGVWRSSTPQVWARVLAASDSNFNDVPQRAMWMCYDLPGLAALDAAVPGAMASVHAGQQEQCTQRAPARIVHASPHRYRHGADRPDSAQVATAAKPPRPAFPDP